MNYKPNEKDIKVTKSEKDLGMHVQDHLKFEKKINDSVREANNMFRIIKHTFIYLDVNSLFILYRNLNKCALYQTLFEVLCRDVKPILT